MECYLADIRERFNIICSSMMGGKWNIDMNWTSSVMSQFNQCLIDKAVAIPFISWSINNRKLTMIFRTTNESTSLIIHLILTLVE